MAHVTFKAMWSDLFHFAQTFYYDTQGTECDPRKLVVHLNNSDRIKHLKYKDLRKPAKKTSKIDILPLLKLYCGRKHLEWRFQLDPVYYRKESHADKFKTSDQIKQLALFFGFRETQTHKLWSSDLENGLFQRAYIWDHHQYCGLQMEVVLARGRLQLKAEERAKIEIYLIHDRPKISKFVPLPPQTTFLAIHTYVVTLDGGLKYVVKDKRWLGDK